MKSVLLFLARIGFFRYEGAYWRIPFLCPCGRVVYPNGSRSVKMALGNAVEYAAIFGGEVEVVKKWPK